MQRIQAEEGVSRVTLTWATDPPSARIMPMIRGTDRPVGMSRRRGMMRFHHGRITAVSPPHYDAQAGQETLSLISHLNDETGRTVGTLEVVIRFDALIAGILTTGWGEGTVAGLVDKTGRYLAHTDPRRKGRQLGDTEDPVEKATLVALQTQTVGTLFGSGHPPRWVSGFYRLQAAPWTVVLFAPGPRVLAPIIRFLFFYILIGVGGIGGILLLIRVVGGPIVSSIRALAQAAEQIAQGQYNVPLPVNSHDEIGHLIHSFHTMVNGLKERDFLSNTFGRYVDREIARELLRRPAATRLGGERRDVAILISDLRRFTPLAESLSPEAIISLLNRYFAAMIDVIQQHRGIIVDFFGDGILVFFDPWNGAIVPTVERAVQCALAMQKAMVQFQVEIQADQGPQLKMGIGVNAGEVVVGNIGSETRAKYGIVGSAVNVTQRIQALAEGGEVVISETAYRYTQTKVGIKASLFHWGKSKLLLVWPFLRMRIHT